MAPKKGVTISGNLFDPNESFWICKGLLLSNNFEKYILSVAKKIKPFLLPDHILGFDLPREMKDKEIRAELGEGYIFSASEGCFVIAEMTSRQPNGEKGDLLNNDRANIFYVRGKADEVFAMHGDCCVGVRKWYMNALRVDDLRWLAGYRAFSRNSILAK